MATPAPIPEHTALVRFAPIFPVADMARAVEHYTKLGFVIKPYEEGMEYAFADRDGVQLHLSYTSDHDPATTAACVYLYVTDARALADEWRQTGSGRTDPARDMAYGIREAVHVDPDNNMIKFGSPI